MKRSNRSKFKVPGSRLFGILAFVFLTLNFEPGTLNASTGCNYPSSLDSWADKIAGDQLTIADVNQFRCAVEQAQVRINQIFAGKSGGQTITGDTASGGDLTLSSTAHATKGQIFFGAAGVFDEVNKRIGINTLTPAVDFQIEKDVSVTSRVHSAGTSAVASYVVRRARNTLASPTAVQSGDTLGLFVSEAHDGSAYQTATYILPVATENWTGSVRGSGLEFWGNVQGTTTFALMASIKAGIGLEMPAVSSFIRLNEASATPSPTADTQAIAYMKADKFIIAYNEGGTVRYKYLDLTGTGATWTHTTSAP